MAAYVWVFAFIGDAPDEEPGQLGTPPTRPQGLPMNQGTQSVLFPDIIVRADADGVQAKIRVSPIIEDEMSARAYVTYPPCSDWYHRCANAILLRVD